MIVGVGLADTTIQTGALNMKEGAGCKRPLYKRKLLTTKNKNMGEIADAMINGLYCEECGDLIDGDEPGYPRLCEACEEE